MKKQLLSFCSIFIGIITYAQPTITSFTPTSGAIGATVTITGTNFDATPANNIVFFGSTQANVSAATTTQLTVTVPVGASYQPISVTNLSTHLSANSAKPFITTFLCNGTIAAGAFATKVDSATGGNGSTKVAIGDLDGDGKIDIIISDFQDNKLTVYRNTSISGSVSYAPKLFFTTAADPEGGVSVADLDGDGKLDIVTANYSSNSVTVLRNTSVAGTISFAAKTDFTVGTPSYGPINLAIADLNKDGKLDIAAAVPFAASPSTTVSVLKNTSTLGNISFAAKVDFTAGAGPYSVAATDIDGDGKAELIVGNNSASTVSVLRNTSTTGTISFATKVDFATGSGPYEIAVGDLDADGKTDFAVANWGSNAISVYRNKSTVGVINTASLAAKVDFTTGTSPYGVSITDLNGDGKLDIASANNGTTTISVLKNTATSGVINASSFAAKVDFTTGPFPGNVKIGDMDGDGKPDLISSSANFKTVSNLRNLISGPLPNVNANASVTGLCTGSPVTLTGSGALTYSWTGGVSDGVSFVPSATVTYTVTGTDANSCSKTDTVSVQVNALPTVTANTTSSVVCAGIAVTLTGGGAASYTWTGSVTDGVSFVPSGTVTYTVTGTDSHNCINTDTVKVIVNTSPTVTANTTNSVVCAGTNVTLTGGGAASYTWSGSVTDGVSFVPTATDTYTVTGTAANNCSKTDTVKVIVNQLPNVSANQNDTTVCAGTSMTLSGTGATTYVWSGSVSNGIAFFPTVTDTLIVTGTNAFNCSNMDSVIITIKPLPTVIANTTDSVICPGTDITLTGSGNATAYTWTSGVTDGLAFAPVSTATYTVTGTDANNCSNTDTVHIQIKTLPDVSTSLTGVTISANLNGATYQWLNCTTGYSLVATEINQTYTATANGSYAVSVTNNGCSDTSACVAISSINVNELQKQNEFTVYPNPFTTQTTITFSAEQKNSHLMVFDVLGALVRNIPLKGKQVILEKAELQAGIYFIQVIDEHNNVWNKRIVIQ